MTSTTNFIAAFSFEASKTKTSSQRGAELSFSHESNSQLCANPIVRASGYCSRDLAKADICT